MKTSFLDNLAGALVGVAFIVAGPVARAFGWLS
jgi:hypothetical protein